MGLLFQNWTIGSAVTLVLFIAFWVLINELSRKSLRASIGLFVVLPIVLAILVALGYLGSPTGKTWFGWVKIVSALIGVYGFMVIRFTKYGNTKFAAYFPVTILSLNIAEAIYREFQVFATYKTLTIDASGVTILGGYWNILNGIAGILTILTLTGFVGITVSKDKYKDMVWPDMTWLYIWGYTLWNFAYVYNCISKRALYAGFAILASALISEYVFKKGVWLQHRAQILSLYAMFSLSLDYQTHTVFQTVPVMKEGAWGAVSIVSFTFNILVFGYLVYTMITKKKNPYKEEILVDTKYYKETLVANNL